MSFREISAWISLVTVAVCFGVYFGLIVTGGPRGFEALHLLLLCVGALVLLQVASHAIAARVAPKDARAPRDERERLIAWRAQSLGYYVLMVGVLALGAPAHLGHPAGDLLNFALLVVVVAVLTVAVAQIVLHRRGL
jgi:cytochrome bd-type quinol oxidase subunit 2